MQSVCDHAAAQVVESSGGTTEGEFEERYECPCGAVGFVSGEASDPAERWNRTGEVFR